MDATSGPVLGDPYYAPHKERPFLEEMEREAGHLKIGLLTSIPDGWSEETQIHPDCENAAKDAAALCEDLGHIVEEISPQELSYPNLFLIFGNIFCCLTGHFIAHWEKKSGKKLTQDQVEPMTWKTYQAGLKWSGADYLGRIEETQRFSRKLAQWYHQNGYDLILSPTISVPPVELGAFHSSDDPIRGFKLTRAFVALTYAYNLAGQPAMSVPLYWNENNVPIGVQFAGRFGDEALLFRLAAQLEQARPWADRKSPIHCSTIR